MAKKIINVKSDNQKDGITAGIVNFFKGNDLKENKGTWANPYFKYLLIPVIAGVILLIIAWGVSKMFGKEENKSKNMYNVTSHNQQGGITAGEVNIGVQPRFISPDAAKLLIDNLIKVPTEKIELRCLMNDAETQNFSYLLKDAFTKANWSVVKELSIYPNKPIKDIVLGVPEQKKDSTAALVLYNWLNQNGFKPTAELVKDSDVFIILVGSKS